MKPAIKFICLFSLYLLLFNTYNTYAADPIIVGIQLNADKVIPGPTKHFQVCKGVPFFLKAENISPSKPTSTAFYQWDNLDSIIAPQYTQAITPTAAGRWVVTIKQYISATLVEAKDTIFLTYYSSVPFNITTTTDVPITGTNITICGSKDSIIAATNGFNEYKWYKNTPTPIIETSRFLTITAALLNNTEGTVSFFVTAKDPNSCNVSKQIFIRRTADIAVNIEGPSVACNGETVTLASPTSPDPNPPYTFVWSTGATATKSIQANLGGTYSLRITHTTLKCSVIDYHTLTAGAGAGITITPDTSICYGTNIRLEASMPGNASYIWNGPGLTNASGSVQNVIPSAQGPNTYSVDVTSNQGCPGTKTTTITVLAPTVNPYFTMSAGNDTVLCDQTSGKLNPSITYSAYPATYSWEWSPSTGLDNTSSKNPTVLLNTTGIANYTVTATDNRGCKQTSSVDVNHLPPVVVYTNFTDSSACFGNILQIETFASGGSTNPGGYTYSFNPPSGTITGNSMLATTGTGTDVYNISAQDAKGCTSNVVNVTISGYAPPVHVSNAKDTVGFKDTPLELNANTPATNNVTWYNLSDVVLGTGPTYTVITDEIVYALVTDPIKGCTNADTVSVTFFEGNPYLVFVPNVFSPDAVNTENRMVKVYGTLIRESDFHFRIYNQWGQLVYQTSSFIEANQTGWTGEIKGNSASQSNAVYTYTVEGKFYDGTDFSKVGTTTLIQ